MENPTFDERALNNRESVFLPIINPIDLKHPVLLVYIKTKAWQNQLSDGEE